MARPVRLVVLVDNYHTRSSLLLILLASFTRSSSVSLFSSSFLQLSPPFERYGPPSVQRPPPTSDPHPTTFAGRILMHSTLVIPGLVITSSSRVTIPSVDEILIEDPLSWDQYLSAMPHESQRVEVEEAKFGDKTMLGKDSQGVDPRICSPLRCQYRLSRSSPGPLSLGHDVWGPHVPRHLHSPSFMRPGPPPFARDPFAQVLTRSRAS